MGHTYAKKRYSVCVLSDNPMDDGETEALGRDTCQNPQGTGEPDK